MRFLISAPFTVFSARYFFFSISSITAIAAAAATGLPPKVLPCDPALKRSEVFPNVIIAANGSPPPKPFAIVIRSGLIPSSSYPNQLPHLPIPVCTASIARRAPFASQICLAAFRYPFGGVTTPASPIIGSRITIEVLLLTALLKALMSPYFTCLTPGSNGLKASLFELCPVRESAPIVLP